MIDPLDAIAQPLCPDCGTTLRDDPRGYACGGCGVVWPDAEDEQLRALYREHRDDPI